MVENSTVSSKKIVLIDNDPEYLQVVGATLSMMGFLPYTFENPLEAIEFIKKESTSIVITDYDMNEITALDVIREVKVFNNRIRVIVISGNPDKMIEEKVLKAGAYSFLNKPLNIKKLVLLASEIS